jgi:hypothetical protein
MQGEVRNSIQECESQIQSVKHAHESEIMRINKAISSLEAKITAGVANNSRSAFPQTVVVRTTAVGQTQSTAGAVGSESSGNGANACDMFTCSDGANVPNTSVSSCNDSINAGSGLYANNTDLSELILPTFTDSTNQV